MKKLIKWILPAPVLDRVRGIYMIVDYHLTVGRKRMGAKDLPGYGASLPAAPPFVTVYVTNSNNRDPLELTLRTLFATVTYPNFEVVVADNNSTDGSIELVESMMAAHPIRLLKGESKPQHEWYDHFASTCSSTYWVGIHEDMIFLSVGWLSDLIGFMESNEETALLGGEYFPPVENMPEPVSGEVVNLRESLSTWIFCARSTLRNHTSTSFAFHKYWDESAQRTVAYDQGGKLIEDIRNEGPSFACMPQWYTGKWQHVGNVTWGFKYDMSPGVRTFKNHQVRDMTRRVRSLRRRSSASATPPIAEPIRPGDTV